MKESIQRVGGAMSGMVIPNIGAFIAWGLITALYIPTGWLPNEDLVQMVGPMILTLLPLLLGYTGGKMVHGHRGGVIGAVVTTAIIVATSSPQFLGAMAIGPAAAWVLKQVDSRLQDNIPEGFEMLYDNFSLGILGWGLAVLAFNIISPILDAITEALGNGAAALVDSGLVPLADIPIEVAKVLFLNNAVNQGVLTPLGAAESAEAGQSIYFLTRNKPRSRTWITSSILVCWYRHVERIRTWLNNYPFLWRNSRNLFPICPWSSNYDHRNVGWWNFS